MEACWSEIGDSNSSSKVDLQTGHRTGLSYCLPFHKMTNRSSTLPKFYWVLLNAHQTTRREELWPHDPALRTHYSTWIPGRLILVVNTTQSRHNWSPKSWQCRSEKVGLTGKSFVFNGLRWEDPTQIWTTFWGRQPTWEGMEEATFAFCLLVLTLPSKVVYPNPEAYRPWC